MASTLSLGKDPNFLCGVGISVYQNSGGENTNWSWFEQQKKAEVNLRLRFSAGDPDDVDGVSEQHDGYMGSQWLGVGPSKIEGNERIGVASDFWNRYEEDIKRAADLGSNCFRLSMEWSRIQPKRGVVDEEAVARYHQFFDIIEQYKMEPNVTLHWFVHPSWFDDELGGWLDPASIDAFAEWAALAYKLFGKRSKLWSTFNEPGVASNCGYILGNHPPGKIAHFREGGTCLLNMLRAHTAAYKAIKGLPGGGEASVGLVHNVFWMEPKGNGLLYAHVKAGTGIANRMWANEVVMNYLKTGVYEFWVPTGGDIRFEDPDGKPGCDWFGVNHYSRAVVDWKMMPSVRGGKGITDMGYPIYPPSLYRAISYGSQLGVPVYVTENGMPAMEDDERRSIWINGCLGMVERAVNDGFDVRGYMYWTLIDNFEWNFAWQLKFGLYEWNDDGTQKRRLREGAKVIKKWYREMPERLGKVLASRAPGEVGTVKSEEERVALEKAAEEEWLRQDGRTEEEVAQLEAQDDEPLLVGVPKPSHA